MPWPSSRLSVMRPPTPLHRTRRRRLGMPRRRRRHGLPGPPGRTDGAV